MRETLRAGKTFNFEEDVRAMLRMSLTIGAVLSLAVVSVASAQQRGGGGRGFNNGVAGLLTMPAVQQELNLSEDQKKQLADKLPSAADRANFRNLSVDERRKQAEERSKKTEEAAKSVLKPEQMERLSQLRLQREGGTALERAEVADKLGLTQEQKDKIHKISQEARGGRAGAGQGASQEERRQAASQARERRQKANDEISTVLTPAQKENWGKMQGKKFEFPQRGPGRRNAAA
jgi:Spy/CpxP family protein refolding chaperone